MASATNDDFLAPSLKKLYALYVMRYALLQAITKALPHFKGTLIDVGCGQMPYRELIITQSPVTRYLGVDWKGSPYHGKVEPDYYWNGRELPFESESADICMATEVLEHLPNPMEVLSEMHRILKPDGTLFLTIPFFWPFHEVPYDEYRYTPFALKRILKEAGFADEKISIQATGGWLASLAQMLTQVISIEVRNPRYRKWLIKLSIPFIKWLLRKDHPPLEFTNHSMALGLSVIALK